MRRAIAGPVCHCSPTVRCGLGWALGGCLQSTGGESISRSVISGTGRPNWRRVGPVAYLIWSKEGLDEGSPATEGAYYHNELWVGAWLTMVVDRTELFSLRNFPSNWKIKKAWGPCMDMASRRSTLAPTNHNALSIETTPLVKHLQPPSV